MTVPAFIYARFSTAEQSKGSSLERQLSDGRDYVQKMGWLYDPEREITDEGRSAFHGSNRAEGSKLYDFEQKALAGHFANGAVLAVENFDRLTRQGWEQATDLIRKLVQQGVTIAVWQYDEVFHAGERIDSNRIMRLIMFSEFAHDQSRIKSERLKAAWKRRIEAAQIEGQATKGPIPGWLERDPKTKLPVANAHKVAVLNEVFDRYIEGVGIPRIMNMLNERNEPTWGRGKHANKLWNVGTLHKYLTSRTVLGEYQPQERFNQGHKRRAKCPPIPDFYPQAISAEKFNRAQAVRKTRTGWGGNGTATQMRNVFTGIAHCSECGSRMHITYPNSGRSYLYCFDNKRGNGCANGKYIRYQNLEAGVFSMLPRVFERAFARQAAKPASALQERLAEAERQLALKQSELAVTIENLGKFVSEALARRAAELEQAIQQEDEAVVRLRREVSVELGKPLPKEEIEEVSRLAERLADGDYETRARVNAVLRRLIDAMECKPDGSTMLVAGNMGIGLTFDAAGTCTDVSALNAVYLDDEAA